MFQYLNNNIVEYLHLQHHAHHCGSGLDSFQQKNLENTLKCKVLILL